MEMKSRNTIFFILLIAWSYIQPMEISHKCLKERILIIYMFNS